MRHGLHIQILPDRKIVAINMKTGDEASVAHVFILLSEMEKAIEIAQIKKGPKY